MRYGMDGRSDEPHGIDRILGMSRDRVRNLERMAWLACAGSAIRLKRTLRLD